MLIKDLDIMGWKPWLRFVWKAHITNWLWTPSLDRRLRRQKYYSEMKDSYFNKYLSFTRNLRAEDTIDRSILPDEEKIFSLWFQGEENAPEVVKSCLGSVRKIYGDRFVVLDNKTLPEYITLPDYIWEKWEKKQIIPANFSDIVRIELLHKYGGYWFDATDYLISPIPGIIKDADFFMYVTSPVLYTHMFVQTCFLRAKKGDPLLKMWRDLVWEYWRQENRAADYFLVHMLLKFLINHNEEAKKLYEAMPHFYQDHLHDLWYDYGHRPFDPSYLEKMREDSFFQKCSYRKLKHAVNEIQPGTMADVLINKGLPDY